MDLLRHFDRSFLPLFDEIARPPGGGPHRGASSEDVPDERARDIVLAHPFARRYLAECCAPKPGWSATLGDELNVVAASMIEFYFFGTESGLGMRTRGHFPIGSTDDGEVYQVRLSDGAVFLTTWNWIEHEALGGDASATFEANIQMQWPHLTALADWLRERHAHWERVRAGEAEAE